MSVISPTSRLNDLGGDFNEGVFCFRGFLSLTFAEWLVRAILFFSFMSLFFYPTFLGPYRTIPMFPPFSAPFLTQEYAASRARDFM